VYERPADIPELLRVIESYHGALSSTPDEYRNILNSQQLSELGRLSVATAAYNQAVKADYHEAEGEAGKKYLSLLVAYYKKWIALSS
jgi:hypothetical protein